MKTSLFQSIFIFIVSCEITFVKGIQAVRIDFFLYIKSCQYSMFYNMRQVQPETLPKNSNFSSCLQNSTAENFGFLAADDHNE
jgi:hypothetical protein